jgi:hypothetical protein
MPVRRSTLPPLWGHEQRHTGVFPNRSPWNQRSSRERRDTRESIILAL